MKDWQDRIVADSGTLFGKPRIKGSRIGVEFLLDRLADGWSETDILESYPNITRQDLQAVFAFLRDCMHEETFVMDAAVQTVKVPR